MDAAQANAACTVASTRGAGGEGSRARCRLQHTPMRMNCWWGSGHACIEAALRSAVAARSTLPLQCRMRALARLHVQPFTVRHASKQRDCKFAGATTSCAHGQLCAFHCPRQGHWTC